MNYNFFDVIFRALRAQGDNLKQQVIRVTKVTSKIATKVITFVRNTITSFLGAPKSSKDYISFGTYMLSKRLVFIALAAILCTITLFINVIYPWMDGRLWISRMELNSTKFLSFTGKARVYDTGGVVIYEGDMLDGTLTGSGKQYDMDGMLVYEGNFEEGQYNGHGRYYEEQVLRYDGSFQNNRYVGEGKLYNGNGRLIYNGSFAEGVRSGIGTEFNPNTGAKSYFGLFAGDKKEGNGTAFDQDGKTVIYEGLFLQGVYEGNGKQYQDGTLYYIGEFSDGTYSGTGVLYDQKTRSKRYEGEFKAGLYEGNGKLYDPENGKLIYSGAFEAGRRNGVGETYDKLGAVTFKGNYKDGVIDLMSYLGQDIETFYSDFGSPSKCESLEGVSILSFPRENLVVIAKAETETSTMVCWKIISGLREEFSSIRKSSTQADVQALFGTPFTALELELPAYYETVFAVLGCTIVQGEKISSEKYVQEGYYIRMYYDQKQGNVMAVEMCGL